jgi:hypothetical protein
MNPALRLLLTLFTILCCTTISGANIQETHSGVVFEKACVLEGEVGFWANFNAPKSTAQVRLNNVQGKIGEDAVRQRLLNSKSVDLMGEQIQIATPGIGSYRSVDFLVRGKKTGIMRSIEVKTGNATRNSSQLLKDQLIANPLAPTTFRGNRLLDFGFPRGTPTGPIRAFEVNASNLR